MIEIAKLVAGAKLNAATPPVEPTRASSGTGEEKRTGEADVQTPQVSTIPVASSEATALSQPQAEPPSVQVKEKDVVAAITKANGQLSTLNTSLRFEVNKETEKVIVRLVQSDTGEVIRQYPPEEIVKMSERIEKALKDMKHGDDNAIIGVLVDRKH